MSDARMVTDYSNHCSKNIPVGRQYPTTRWMQRNAEEVINYSRTSSAIAMGSVFPFDTNVVPPPVSKISCTRGGCSKTFTGAEGGIGDERSENEFPELFGTFTSDTLFPAKARMSDRTGGTTHYEGGRNSLRGDKHQMSSSYY
jgi:hypothetical protein